MVGGKVLRAKSSEWDIADMVWERRRDIHSTEQLTMANIDDTQILFARAHLLYVIDHHVTIFLLSVLASVKTIPRLSPNNIILSIELLRPSPLRRRKPNPLLPAPLLNPPFGSHRRHRATSHTWRAHTSSRQYRCSSLSLSTENPLLFLRPTQPSSSKRDIFYPLLWLLVVVDVLLMSPRHRRRYLHQPSATGADSARTVDVHAVEVVVVILFLL